MSKINPQHATVFVVVFAVLAVCINSAQNRSLWQPSPSPAYVPSSAQQQQQFQDQEAQQKLAAAKAEVERQAAADAAAKHAAYLARYLNAGTSRTSGMRMLAIVTASEGGKLEQAVNTALAEHFKTGTVEALSSVFTPEFISDGLFTQAFSGSAGIFKNLEIARSVDAVLLARQTVQYSKDASMENLVSATMQLEVMLSPLGSQGQSQSWTFTAYGSGFDQKAARAMAEERIITQIAKDTKMTF